MRYDIQKIGLIFGNFLKELRKKAGLTQEGLAQSISVTTNTVKNYESGRTLPKCEHLVGIANFFNCSVESLLVGIKEDNRPEIKSEYVPIVEDLRQVPGATTYMIGKALVLADETIEGHPGRIFTHADRANLAKKYITTFRELELEDHKGGGNPQPAVEYPVSADKKETYAGPEE